MSESEKHYESEYERSHVHLIALFEQAIIYTEKGEYERALDYYLIAEEVCRTLGLEGGDVEYLILLYSMGTLYRDLGKYSRALEYLLETKNIFDEDMMTDNAWYGQVLESIATVYYHLGKFGKALSFYRTAFETYRALNMVEDAEHVEVLMQQIE